MCVCACVFLSIMQCVLCACVCFCLFLSFCAVSIELNFICVTVMRGPLKDILPYEGSPAPYSLRTDFFYFFFILKVFQSDMQRSVMSFGRASRAVGFEPLSSPLLLYTVSAYHRSALQSEFPPVPVNFNYNLRAF